MAEKAAGSKSKTKYFVLLGIFVVLAAGLLAIPLLSDLSLEDKQALRQRHYDKGLEYYESGEFQAAVIEFKNALQYDPGHADSHYQIGRCYMSQSKVPEGFQSFKQCAKSAPDHIECHINIGALYVLGGDVDNARSSAGMVLMILTQKRKFIYLSVIMETME